MSLTEEVEERLSIFKNLYDVIRIVDPVKKKTIFVKSNNKEISESCYLVQLKHTLSESFLSMDEYIDKDTFIKVEYYKEKLILVIAMPIDIDGNVFIVEILKDITENNRGIYKMAKINAKSSDLSTDRNDDIKLKSLNNQITEMRDMLNEICCTIDEKETEAKRLDISQSLDNLIVEYMKELNN